MATKISITINIIFFANLLNLFIFRLLSELRSWQPKSLRSRSEYLYPAVALGEEIVICTRIC